MVYEIIATGSSGNALVLDGKVLIDCGVGMKHLRPWVKGLQLVLLTHVHGDHFSRSTIRALSDLRPAIRFAAPPWLAHAPAKNVDICAMDTWYDYGMARVRPFWVAHDVPNIGWMIEYQGKKIIYATDTNSIDHIHAPNFDYYFIESNYDEDEIAERIAEKEESGAYIYEYRVMETHLSKEMADSWIIKNAGDNSVIEYLHRHNEGGIVSG